MKRLVAIGLAGLAVVASHAREDEIASKRPEPAAERAMRGDWDRPLVDPRLLESAPRPEPALEESATNGTDEIDVVDAHWMALTMWGEARSEGEEGMRAVGHVIRNRWRARERDNAYVTDTVSEAWQFSCWNAGDPNREKMLAIDALVEGSDEHRSWLLARSLADEILSGRSPDPTGGALYYHTAEVSPRWSRGVTPVARIGDHLFFLAAR